MAGSKHILIIEDDQFISDMYARTLVRDGYQVEFATNGRDGITKANESHYDLIFLDIMMPEMTGIDVLHELRAQPSDNTKDTKIIILTNLAQDKQSKEALAAEADGYLIKADVVPSKLLEITKDLIGDPPSQ